MKWTDDPKDVSIVSLMDDTGTAILGQLVREPNGKWKANDYTSNNGQGVFLGTFVSALGAKDAVETSVEKGLVK